MTRVSGWPRLLDDYIDACRHRPFVWGEHDCGLFAANWIRMATGYDAGAQWRGRYTTERGAWRVLMNDGLRTMEDVGMAAMGDPMDPAFAGRGDAASVLSDGLVCLGIHIGHRIACAGADGLVFLPVSAIRYAWKV